MSLDVRAEYEDVVEDKIFCQFVLAHGGTGEYVTDSDLADAVLKPYRKALRAAERAADLIYTDAYRAAEKQNLEAAAIKTAAGTARGDALRAGILAAAENAPK